jgi:small redox-active disulfide protein 2
MSEKKGIFSDLFKGKKTDCCAELSCTIGEEREKKASDEGKLDIKILGSGCKNCITLEENTKEALKQMGIEASVNKVTDSVQIAGYGVMSTPGLVLNGKVVSFGKVLKTNDIIKILEKTV